MSVTSSVGIKVNFQGDVIFDQQFDTVSNITSPGANTVQALTTGNNIITVPSGATGVAIIPPDDNAIVLLLKKVAGDTGISLALISPMFLSLNSVTSFVINVSGSVTLRFIWS